MGWGLNGEAGHIDGAEMKIAVRGLSFSSLPVSSHTAGRWQVNFIMQVNTTDRNRCGFHSCGLSQR